MAFSGLGTHPILMHLKQEIPAIFQVWYADDTTGAGQLQELKKWWDVIKDEGTKFGYHVKPSKSWLILKSSEKLEECRQLFGTSINMTVEGKRHLGAALGSNNFKEEYINEKIQKWVANIKNCKLNCKK